MASLHWVDILILATFLVITSSIGVFQAFTGGRQSTIEEFLLDNRRLKVIPTTLSILASCASAVSVLGIPAEIYKWGTQFFFVVQVVGYIISLVIVERLFVPWLYKLKLTSIYEYLRLRFASKAVEKLASTIGIISGVLHMGTAVVSPSIAAEIVAGVPFKMSIFFMVGFCVVYTA